MKLRVRCPLCGMLTHIERLHHEGLYPVVLAEQQFLGRARMRYAWFGASDSRVIALKQYLIRRLQRLLDALTYGEITDALINAFSGSYARVEPIARVNAEVKAWVK